MRKWCVWCNGKYTWAATTTTSFWHKVKVFMFYWIKVKAALKWHTSTARLVKKLAFKRYSSTSSQWLLLLAQSNLWALLGKETEEGRKETFKVILIWANLWIETLACLQTRCFLRAAVQNINTYRSKTDITASFFLPAALWPVLPDFNPTSNDIQI